MLAGQCVATGIQLTVNPCWPASVSLQVSIWLWTLIDQPAWHHRYSAACEALSAGQCVTTGIEVTVNPCWLASVTPQVFSCLWTLVGWPAFYHRYSAACEPLSVGQHATTGIQLTVNPCQPASMSPQVSGWLCLSAALSVVAPPTVETLKWLWSCWDCQMIVIQSFTSSHWSWSHMTDWTPFCLLHFRMVSVCLGKPICALLCLSEVSPALSLKEFQCWYG